MDAEATAVLRRRAAVEAALAEYSGQNDRRRRRLSGFTERGLWRRVKAVWAWLIRRTSEHRPWLSVPLSLLGITGVALGTHVIEQWLGSEAPGWTPKIALLAVLAVGIPLLVLRDRITHRRGTLFYLRLLQPWMRDLHDIEHETRKRGQAEDKIVARWIGSPNHRQVEDLTDETASLVAEAERCLNDDASQTGTHVAPNMIWPAALVVGYDLPHLARGTVELVELLPGGSETSAGQKRPVPSMDWSWSQPAARVERRVDRPRTIWLPPRTDLVRTVVLLVELTSQGRLSLPGWDADVLGRLTVFQHDQAEQTITDRLALAPQATPDERARILLDQDGRPVEIDTDTVRGAARARKSHADLLRGARVPKDAAGYPRLTQQDFDQEVVVVHPRVAAAACWLAIREALHDYPEARLLLAMRVPKTIAVAVGSLLAVEGQARFNPGCRTFWKENVRQCWQPSCMRPWERVVPLTLDEGIRQYRLTRVHPFQPAADELVELLGEEPARKTVAS